MNKQMIAIVVLISLGAVLALGALVLRSRTGSVTNTIVENKALPPSANNSVQQKPNIVLIPQQKKVKVGQQFTIDIESRSIKGKVTGLDLLLSVDPTLATFESVDNIPESYIKGRGLVEDTTLIISIIESISTTQTASATPERLGTLTFRAQKPGVITMVPIINETPKTSMLLIGDSLQNALTGINEAQVIITP
ncbi:MAG: cohesin domain-containing protein [Candidatus Roizmanbacteria bacterium]|nr:cohesin domain-containing protein [Candidatus Roizmanbacteria bacterium]